MPDREKVIKGLEEIQKYLDTGYILAISWKSELIRDAISLLKEQQTIDTREEPHLIEVGDDGLPY